jgi:hypothetical protein
MKLAFASKAKWVLALILLTASVSCNRRDPNIPKVARAVQVFDDRFNQGKFHEIYADADLRFQQSVSEHEFSEKLATLLREHGPIQEIHVNGVDYMNRWQRLLPELKPTRFIGYYTKCTNGTFQQLFIFDVTGAEAKLMEFETSIEDANRKRKH